MTEEIELRDGWIEREPEQFEDRLFVTAETYDDVGVARAHIAYYQGEGTVEFCNGGNYEFESVENEAEAAATIHEFMVEPLSGDGKLLSHYS